MHRRAPLLPALLLVAGLASAVLVARVPSDLERTVVTPLNHGADALLSAALLRFGTSSLLTSPARYFSPPILHPDPNPLRGTEPLVAQALLGLPFRLALGDRPAPVYTCVKILTLALLALATGLLLRELGVRDSLCVAGGAVSVLVATTAAFVDRIQAVSLQWLPFALVAAVRYWRTGRARFLAALALSAFLFVQASLYTTVMALGVLPFLLPLAAALALSRRDRAAGLALGLAAATLLSVAVLWPYLRDRTDVAAYATSAYASEKSWNPAFVAEALVSPPEFGPAGWPLRPHASWNGFFPGHAFLLLVAASAALAWPRGARAQPEQRATSHRARAFRGCRWILLGAGGGLVLTLAVGERLEHGAATRALADVFVWGALLAWSLRLALWPPSDAHAHDLPRAASAAGLAAAVFFLLALGSPVRLHHEEAAVANGIFGPLSSLVPPLRELRELRRFLLPAGWAAVVAATLALERGLSGRPPALGAWLAAAVVGIGMGERVVADTRKAQAPPPPPAYELLRQSRGRGGLVELPVDTWAQITSIHRMLWQPSHGRPILAGRTGLDPSWYQPAREVFDEFPSQESLRLARAWGLDTVLDRRPAAVDPASSAEGVVLRGERLEEGRLGRYRLFDILPASGPALGPEPEPGPGAWQRPPWATVGPSAAAAVVDGSLETAALVADPDGLSLVTPEHGLLTAVELDYGLGRFSRVPPELRVLGLRDGEWVELAGDDSRLDLRARAANQLMRERRARLVVTLAPGAARRLRLVSPRLPWEVPEVRVRVAPEAAATEPRP